MGIESVLIPQIMAGLVRGSVIMLVVIGLSLTFGVLDIINFAHGEFATIGSYFALFFVFVLGGSVGYWVALIAVPLLVAIVAMGMERITFRPIEGRDPLYYILLTFGLGIIIREGIKWTIGPDAYSFRSPQVLDFSIQLYGKYPFYRVFLVVAAFLVAVLFYLVISYTEWGRSVRAVAFDSDVASMMGVNSTKIRTQAFGLGAALAGIGGVLASPVYSVYPFFGFDQILLAFIAIVAGGMGSIRGSIIMSLVFGQLMAVGSIWIPSVWTVALPFFVTMIIIAVLPNGIEEILP